FFFSSRRRHTRSKRDWSSDVCSSDLGAGGRGGAVIVGVAKGRGPVVVPWSRGAVAITIAVPRSRGPIAVAIAGGRGFVVIWGRGGVVFIAVVLSPVGVVLVGGLAVLGCLAGLPGERGHVEGDRGAGVRGGRDGPRRLGVLGHARPVGELDVGRVATELL